MDQKITRRRFLELSAGAGTFALGGLAAACAPAPAPTPAAPKPAAPVAPAATPTPAKATFTPASIKGITIEGLDNNVAWLTGKEKGFFQEFGIDITVEGVGGGNEVIAGLVGGTVNFADQSPSTMLVIATKDPSVKAIGGSRPGLTYVVVSQKSINSLKELEGKSVGIGAARALLHQVTTALLKRAGADPGKVTFASIGSSSAIYRAVVAGKIDAGIADLSAISVAERDGVKILAEVWKELPRFYRGAFWATTKTISEKGDVLARTMAGYAKSYRYITTAPEAKDLFLKIAIDTLKVPRDQAEFQWDFFQKNPNTLARNLELPTEAIMDAQQLNVDFGNQEKVLPFEQVTDLSFQKKALELAGMV